MEIIDIKNIIEDRTDPVYVGTLLPSIAYINYESISDEINDEIKTFTFMQEHIAYLLMLSDMHLYSKHGLNGRDKLLKLIECGLYNMLADTMDRNYKEAAKYELHVNARMKKYYECASIKQLTNTHSFELIQLFDLNIAKIANILPIMIEVCHKFPLQFLNGFSCSQQ